MSSVGVAPPDPARRDGRHRSRRSRRPRSPRHGPRSSWPRRSWPPSHPLARADPRLGRATLRTEPAGRGRERSSKLASSRPTSSRPSWIATVAGTAPAARTAASGRARDLEVLRIRQAVADERRLERDDRATVVEGASDIGRDEEAIGKHRGQAYQSAVPWHGRQSCPTGIARRVAATLTPMPNRRPFVPEDIRRQVVLEEHDVAADGRLAVVGRRSVRRNQYEAHLWVVPLGDGRPARARRLTFSPSRDRWPRISPDGRLVAFIRRPGRPDRRRPRISLIAIDGGRVRADIRAAPTATSTNSPGRRTGPADRLHRRGRTRRGSLVGRRRPGRTRPRRQRTDEDHADARRITGRTGASTASGTSIAGRTSSSSTSGAARVPARSRPATGESAGSPGARTVGPWPSRRTAARSRTCDPRTTIWAVDVDARPKPREVLAPAGWAQRPAYSPDGRWLAAIGILEADALDDVSPGLIVGPSGRVRDRPWPSPRTSTGRSATGPTRTSTAGWSNRPGPVWVGPTRSSRPSPTAGGRTRGRSAWIPGTGEPGGSPAGPGRTATSLDPLAGGRRRTVVVTWLGRTVDGRAMELMTARRSRPGAAERPRVERRWGPPGSAAIRSR